MFGRSRWSGDPDDPEMGFPILGSRIPRSIYGSPDGVTGVHSRIIIHTLMIPMIPIYPPLGRDVWYYGGIMMMYYILYLFRDDASRDTMLREIRRSRGPEMGFPILGSRIPRSPVLGFRRFRRSGDGRSHLGPDPHMVLRMYISRTSCWCSNDTPLFPSPPMGGRI